MSTPEVIAAEPTLESLVAEFEGMIEGADHIYGGIYDLKVRLSPDETKTNISLITERDDSHHLIGLTLSIPRSGKLEIQIPEGDPAQLTISATAWDEINQDYNTEGIAPYFLGDAFNAQTLEQKIAEILRFIQSFSGNDTAYLAQHAEALVKAREIVRQAIEHQSIVSGANSPEWTTIHPEGNTFAASANFKEKPGNEDTAHVSENRVCVVDGVSTATDSSGFAVEKHADIPVHTLIAGAVAQGMSLAEIKTLIEKIPDLRNIRAAIVDAVRNDDTNEWTIHHAGDTRWFVIAADGAVIQRSTMDHRLGHKLASMSVEEKKTHVQAVINNGQIEGQVNFDDEQQLDTICRYTLRENSRTIGNAFPQRNKALSQSIVTLPEGGLLYLCTDGVDDFIAPQHVGQMWATHQKVSTVGQEICDTVSGAQGVPRKIMVGTGMDGQPVWLSIPGTYGDHATLALVAT